MLHLLIQKNLPYHRPFKRLQLQSRSAEVEPHITHDLSPCTNQSHAKSAQKYI
jgi:hypothetical protein